MGEILHQAEQLEKDYDWFGAAGLYEKSVSLLPKDDFLKVGDCYERLGYAFYRFAFQAETNEEFRDRLRRSAVTYEKAIEFYGRPKESVKVARTLRCKAMIAHIGYWLALETHEKKRLIDECWRLASEALKAFEGAGEVLEYGKAFNQFSKSADLSFCLEWNWQNRERVMKEATKYGERAIEFLFHTSKQ